MRRKVSDPLEALQGDIHEVLIEVKEINGSVKRHEEELFGDETHGTVGVVSRVRVLEDLGLKLETGIKVVIGIVALIGITNIMLLLRT